MKADQVILSRQLPKTGQEIIYEAGDDGDIQAGWWLGLKVADNKERFVSFTSGGKGLVLDRATGLIWPADWSNMGDYYDLNGSFANNFIYWLPEVNSLNYGGYSDWRIPNINELCSLINWGRGTLSYYADVFSGCEIAWYWSSTTDINYTDWAFALNFGDVQIVSRRKTDWNNRIAVRGGL